MGHELRNPLGVITNSVYVLRLLLPDVPEQVKEYLDLIESEAYAATRIIGDLLEFLESRRPCPRLSPLQSSSSVASSDTRCVMK